jgi:RHS repeat-associated protein
MQGVRPRSPVGEPASVGRVRRFLPDIARQLALAALIAAVVVPIASVSTATAQAVGEVIGDEGCSGGMKKVLANGDRIALSPGPNPPPCPNAPNVSPDGKLVVYLSVSGGQADIWLTDSLGAWKRQLTGGTADDATPQFSPDGSRIGFLRKNGTTVSVNYIDLVSGALVQLALAESTGDEPIRFSQLQTAWNGNDTLYYVKRSLDTGLPLGKPWRYWYEKNLLTGVETFGKSVDSPTCPFGGEQWPYYRECFFLEEIWSGNNQVTNTPAATSLAEHNNNYQRKGRGVGYLSVSPNGQTLIYHGVAGNIINTGGNETFTANQAALKAWRTDGQKIYYSQFSFLDPPNTGVFVMNPDFSSPTPVSTGSALSVYDHAFLDPNGGPQPRPGQSIGHCGGVGVHANSGGFCQHDPVSSLTGAFTTSALDLRLPGIGVPFSWSRSYTSSDTTVGRLGPGWTDSYGTSLAVQGNGDVILRGDEGQQVYYTKQLDNSFVGAAGALSVLSQVAGGYQLVRRDQVVYLFDTAGRLTSMKDRNNQGLTLAYDGSGQLQTVTDSVGRQIAVAYTGGLLSRVTLPDSRYVEYSYTSGRLSSVRDARGGTTQYTYDTGGRLKKIIDQNQHTVVDNTYGTSGRVTQQVDARGKIGTFSWNPATQTQTYTDARQHEWKDVYAGNLLVERSDPLGNTTRFEYDAGLNMKKVTDARGNATTMTYDTARGNLLTRTAPAPLAYQEIWTYNARNDPLTYRDRRGNTTDFGYDTAGNLTSVTAPDPDGGGPLARPQTLYGRDPAGTGLLTSLTDPRGKQTTFAYTNGNLTEIRTQLGNRTTMGYDGSGRMTSLVDPRGNALGTPALYTWEYAYNEADQLRTQTDPLSNLTVLQYDPAGNLFSRTDAKLHVTSYGYDEANNLTTVTAPDPDGGGPLAAPVTQYTYDDVANLSTRKDANLRETVYGYDNADRLISVTAPLNRVWTYGYDPNGNATQVVDPNGNATPAPGDGQTTHGYDALNRLTSSNYSDATPDVTLAYDGNDNQTQMIDGSGTETYTHDALDRLTAVTRGSNAFSYVHDLANLTQVTYPGGATTSRTFDDDERLQSVTSGGLTTTYAYDEAGNLRTTTLPSASQLVETRMYDRAGRLVDVESKRGTTIRAKFAITRDPLANPTQIVRTGALAQTQTYAYDNMDRLAGVCFQAGTCPGGADPFVRWSYDGVGNRLTEVRPAGTTSYTYNAADELTQAGSTAYTYDQNGNQLSAGSRTFTYDLANRLKTTTLAPTTTTYLYDGLGKRLQASTGTAASAKTNFLWDVSHALPQVALERNGNNVLQRQYVYGHRRIQQTVGTQSYYLYDALGSVANTTSSTGAVQRTWSYEPFGLVRTQSGSSPTNLWQFTGEYADPTGLYHLRARQYEPASGRFLGRDVVEAWPAAHSAFTYVGNQPTVLVDPTGLAGEDADRGDCPGTGSFLAGLVGVKEVYCEGFQGLSPTWQGLLGVTVEAGPQVLPIGPGPGFAMVRLGGKGLSWSWKTRARPGADSGISKVGIERLGDDAISQVHRVTVNGKVVHQHQTHIGKYGGQRQFPDDWVQFPSVGSP